jgi:hypothetical protein
MSPFQRIPLLPEEAHWLENLRVGDQVTRWLAGVVPMPLAVTAIKGGLIECGLWTFDARNGAEVDPELGWDEGGTGSYIRPCSH